MQRGDATRAPLPFYIGDDVKLIDTALSPDARWMIAVTAPKNHEEGRKGKLTRYVTESGYEEFEDERIRAGRNDPPANELWLIDIAAHTQTKLAFDGLPGVNDDPFKAIRDENAKRRDEAQEKSGEEIRRQAESARHPDHRHRLSRAMARPPPCNCAPTTTRIAGSRRSMPRRRNSPCSSVCTIRRGSTGTSTNSAGRTTAARCGTCRKNPAMRSCMRKRSAARRGS